MTDEKGENSSNLEDEAFNEAIREWSKRFPSRPRELLWFNGYSIGREKGISIGEKTALEKCEMEAKRLTKLAMKELLITGISGKEIIMRIRTVDQMKDSIKKEAVEAFAEDVEKIIAKRPEYFIEDILRELKYLLAKHGVDEK